MCEIESSEISEARSPGQQSFLRWRLNFVHLQYGTCFALLASRTVRWLLDFWKTLPALSYRVCEGGLDSNDSRQVPLNSERFLGPNELAT